ncbi:MAG: DUF898 domain-containing protein [Ideonella sp.]|nr:DUF898 domain-containing protein [Ideonella sp.]
MNDFQPTVPMPDDAVRGLPEPRRLTIRFTGSGSEYFRIWIVNLLLTAVTLTLYHPWAKVRRLRYFHGNTLVDGHPLDFHGDPKKMLRGHLLVGAMLGLYTVATRVSPEAGLFAVTVVAALWPALMRASLQFRLANTSWRGMRFHFDGSVAGAYGAMLPLFVPALLLVALPLAAVAPGQPPGRPTAALWPMLALLLASGAAVPWMAWRLKRYQIDHTEFGGQRCTLRVGPGAFYGLSLKWGAVTLLTAVVVAVVVIAPMAWRSRSGDLGPPGTMAMIGFALGLLAYVTVFVTSYPYLLSRMQNLVWNGTASEDLRFESALRFRPLLALSLRNLVLVLITLGLYWPFARIALARLRLEAVAVDSHIDPDALASARASARTEATGDAAGDLFGIDFGL